MDRTTNTAINWLIGPVIGYLAASRSLDRRETLKSALVSATITAVVAWVGYEDHAREHAGPDAPTP